MPAQNDSQPNQPWWRRNSRWWVLSAALGILTVASMVGIVHDTSQQRSAGRLAARAAAEQAAATAGGRLRLLALGTFAPVTDWVGLQPLPARQSLNMLVRGQLHGERCKCRETLPATEFFRYDVATKTLDTALTPSNHGDGPPPATALLAALALSETNRPPDRQQPSVHLLADPRLGARLLVTVVQRGDSGRAVTVFGLVTGARAASISLFLPTVEASSSIDSHVGLPPLDSASLEVLDAQGSLFFGALGADRPFTATVLPLGPLEGLVLKVGYERRQLVTPARVATMQIWHLGALLLVTVLAIAIAAGSTRREVLLARARADFIAGVSHDLRMPLAQILLAGESLSLPARRKADEKKTLLTTIVRETRRLMGLVENVLLYSRSGSVELSATLRPLCTADLFADVVEAVRLAADEAGQLIDVQAGDGITVLGDRHLLRQALVNLLDNALKYGQAGQRIRLVAEQYTPELVRLSVEDKGPGIPPDQRTRVFEPYERLERDLETERTGSGLGLAVVRDIARACSGRVWLEDAVGWGLRAVIELRSTNAAEEPPVPVDEPAVEPVEPVEPPAAAES